MSRRPGSSRWLVLSWCLAGVAACGGKGIAPADGSMDHEGAAGAHATAGTTGGGGAGGEAGSSAGGSGGLGGITGGGGTGFFPGCHHDCGGGISCSGGVVYSRMTVAVSCEAWTGSCPAETHPCTMGCTVEGSSVGNTPISALKVLCAETPAAKVGDSCYPPGSPCLPVRSTDGPDGGVTTDHLGCDSTNKCAASADPPLAGFGTACQDLTLSASAGTGFTSFAACPKGYCLRFDDQTAGCVRSGCTTYCAGDHDCPSGWYCDRLKNLLAGATDSSPMCRPGPRAGVPRTLACLPQ